MGKHFPLIDDEETVEKLRDGTKHVHVLLIRNPKKVIMSWNEAVKKGNTQADAFTMEEIGLCYMVDVLKKFKNVIVVDSDGLVFSPEKTLKVLCEKIGCGFDEKMMQWESGPKEFDGAWADWWYASAHKSEGWSKTATKPDQTPEASLVPLIEANNKFFDQLKPLAIDGQE